MVLRRLVPTMAWWLIAASAAAAAGDWQPNGVRVPGTGNRQARMLPDTAGGVFVVTGAGIAASPAPTQVRLHHLRADGTADPALPDSGRTVWTNAQDVLGVLAWSDRSGGMLVLASACGPGVPPAPCFESGVLRLLHLDGAGNLVPGWPVDGLGFANAHSPESNLDHVDVSVAADGRIGVAWSEFGSGVNRVIVQTYSAGGVAQWTPDFPYAGRNVFVASQSYLRPRLVPDAAGGWIVGATRIVGDPPTQTTDVVVNRLRGSDGARQWGSAGALAMQIAGDVAATAVVGDGAGGAVLGGGGGGAARVQRVDANGSRSWGSGGRVLGTDGAGAMMLAPPAAAEPGTIAYASWLDTAGVRRVQRLTGAGAAWPEWPIGRPVDEAGPAWAMARPVAREEGGAWLFWGAGLADGDVRALPLDSTGVAAGGATDAGIVLCDAPGAQHVTDAGAQGGAIFALWSDARSEPGASYAQRWTVATLASPPATGGAFTFGGVRPNPARGAWSAALRLAASATVRLEVLDLAGRRVAGQDLGPMPAGAHTVTIAVPGALAPGVYRVRCTAGGAEITRTAVRLR